MEWTLDAAATRHGFGCTNKGRGFSVLATLAQWGLLTAALVSPMMASTSNVLGAGLLLMAGVVLISFMLFLPQADIE